MPPTLGSVTTPAGVDTDPLNLDPLVQQAYQHFYTLDYDGALQRFEKVKEAHPGDPLAVDYVLDTTLFRELYRLDLLDTTFYANDGFLTGKHTVTADPEAGREIGRLAALAISLADQRLKADPKDADALFARGWARSLKSVYTGLVERGFVSALHLALQARGDNEKVLELDPKYVDARMIVGVHQYVVGSLPLGFKVMAGMAGITGSKSKGLDDLREAGKNGVIASVEARTALALFLRREAKYDEAIVIARSLNEQYPRDFLFWLEVANLTKDAGDGPGAIQQYRALLDKAKRPGYFPSAHVELAWFGLAETLRGQNEAAEAAAAYERAAAQPTTSLELKRRCQLDAGEMYDLLKRRDKAREQYEAVLSEGSDSAQAERARRYLKDAFSPQ